MKSLKLSGIRKTNDGSDSMLYLMWETQDSRNIITDIYLDGPHIDNLLFALNIKDIDQIQSFIGKNFAAEIFTGKRGNHLVDLKTLVYLPDNVRIISGEKQSNKSKVHLVKNKQSGVRDDVKPLFNIIDKHFSRFSKEDRETIQNLRSTFGIK